MTACIAGSSYSFATFREALGEPVEVAFVGQEVELDRWLVSPMGRRQAHLSRFRIGLIDKDYPGTDLFADRVPQEDFAMGSANMSPIGAPSMPEEYRMPTSACRPV